MVVGTAKIQGERLDIGITSLEYDGTIIPVELAVYDTDGQPGIFIPNSMEMNAVREVAANMGGSLGSSINISTNAGAQLASDLGKGLIQGLLVYVARDSIEQCFEGFVVLEFKTALANYYVEKYGAKFITSDGFRLCFDTEAANNLNQKYLTEGEPHD